MTIQYIEYGDNGKVAREKINAIMSEVEASIPSIGENGHWYIGGVDTGIVAVGFTLRDENNLIQRNSDLEAYVDLQIATGITPSDDFQVGVTVGKVLETDGWDHDGLLLNRQTTNGEYARWIYGDDGKLYFDCGDGVWNQIYLASDVDGLFSTLRSELGSVAFSNDYTDLDNKPTIGNGKLTIQRNGTLVNEITMNSTSNVTANIAVPTKTSDITNDSGFITKEVADLTNYTPTSSLGAVATSNDYEDLNNLPDIPDAVSDLDNDLGFIDKDVDDLTNYTKTSDLPTVGTAQITIQKNGTKVDDFGVNATSDKTINITMSKSDVGLGNVDNTSDLNKPISTATQTALDGKQATISDLSTIRDNATAGKSASDTIATYGDIVTHDVDEFATATQGGKADTAVQPGDLGAVATSNDYTDLDNKPTIGDATITIQKNSTNVDSFKTNATSNKTINITMSKSDVGLGNVDNTSDANKPISTATQNALNAITGKIPSEASTTNQLADKEYVGDAINSVTAYYITKDAQGHQFATHAELTSATTFYSGGVVRVPTRNDYTIVLDDEDHDHATTRYSYQGNGWEYQYTVNETPLTQAQLNALNSGITSGKVTSYDQVVSTIATYGNIVTHNTSEFATSTQGGKADTALQPNDNISQLINNAGYITSSDIPTDVSSFNNDAGYITSASLPTVNNAKITVQKNGTKVKDFTLNQSTDETINITVPTKVSDLSNDTGFITSSALPTKVSDLQNDTGFITSASLPTATSDLTNDSGFITSADIPTNVSAFTNDAGYITSASLPTVNNNKITIQKNGTKVDDFTLNQSSDKTINITVPTKVSDITNDSGFITKNVNDLVNYTLTSNLSTVATSGDYTDLNNLPTIPADTADLTNGAGFITAGDLTSGSGIGISGTTISNTGVLSVNGNTGAVTVTPFAPGNTGTAGQVVTKTSSGYQYSDIPSQVNDTAYASSWNGVTTIAPSKNAVYDKIYTMDNAINGKMPGFSINISHAVAGNPREVKFITIDYGTMTQYGASYFRLSAASCHPDGGGYNYMEDIYIGCTYQGVVKCDIIKYTQSSVAQYNPSYESGRYFGDVFYVVDTDAKKVYFYILGGQYTSSDFTPAVKIGSTSLSKVTQHSGTGTYYDTGTKVWANGCGSLVAIKSDIPSKTSQLTNDSGFVTSSIVNDTAYASSWDGDTTHAPTKNAVYDKLNAMETTISGKAENNTVVHLSGAETVVDGLKVFESNDDPTPNSGSVTTSLTLKGKNLKKGGTAGYKYTSIDFKDKDDTLIAKFSGLTTPDGWSGFMAGAGTDPTSTSGNLRLIADNNSNNKLLLIPPTTGHNYGAVRYDYYNNNTVRLSTNQTIVGTKTFSTSPVVPSKSTDAGNNATTIATEAQVYKKQDTLVSGTNIKTINNESILGSGNITISGGAGYTAGTGIDITSNVINARVGKGIKIGDIYSMRGPCAEGFHIPLYSEANSLIDMWSALGLPTYSISDYTGTYLKRPGRPYYRGRDGSVYNNGLGYWTSSFGTHLPYAIASQYNFYVYEGSVGSIIGLPIRAFKDKPTVPDNSWTTLRDGSSIASGAGIFWSSTLGLISISSDGINWITMKDKNEGATTVYNQGDTMTASNCGNLYQWGNNYAFPFSGSVSRSSTKIDASGYGPDNYYSSNTFITASSNDANWFTEENKNLWGGETGLISNTIFNSGVTSINGQTGNISIQGLPSGGTVGQVLQMTANGPAWVTLS